MYSTLAGFVEPGESLEEAVAHQKELKLEIRRRDRELSKVNHKLSEQLEANDLLTETLRRLKVEYNFWQQGINKILEGFTEADFDLWNKSSQKTAASQ